MPDQVVSSIDQNKTTPDDHALIHVDLQSELAKLAHKHAGVSYALIGVIVVVVLFMVFAGFIANKIYEKDVQRAEASEKISEEARKQMQDDKKASDEVLKQASAQINADTLQRQQDAAKIASLEQTIKDRDAQAAKTIAGILTAGKSAKDAYADADAHYTLKSALMAGRDGQGNETLTFLVPDVQQFSATKVKLDTAQADLTSKQGELNSANSSVTSLKADLQIGTNAFNALTKTEQQCEVTVADQKKTIDDYKKAAKVGRWRRIWNGTEKAGIFIGGVLLGRTISKKI